MNIEDFNIFYCFPNYLKNYHRLRLLHLFIDDFIIGILFIISLFLIIYQPTIKHFSYCLAVYLIFSSLFFYLIIFNLFFVFTLRSKLATLKFSHKLCLVIMTIIMTMIKYLLNIQD